jgi:hypothetical protein
MPYAFVPGKVTADDLNSKLPQGIIGEVSPTDGSTTTNVEAFRGTITGTLRTGRKYLPQYWGQAQSSVAGDLLLLRLRYKAGATVDNTGTVIQVMAQHCEVASRNQPVALGKSFTVPSTGQYTVGVSIIRNTGTGNVKLDYGAGLVEPYMVLQDIGPA